MLFFGTIFSCFFYDVWCVHGIDLINILVSGRCMQRPYNHADESWRTHHDVSLRVGV